MTFAPSAHQARFFDWVKNGSGSAVLIAVAGSGKSTTIVRALEFIPEQEATAVLAFNSAIAAEMKTKIAKFGSELGRDFRNVRACTFHSLGFSAVCRKLGKRPQEMTTDGGKLMKLAKEIWSPALIDIYGSYITKLVSLAKGQGLGALTQGEWSEWYAIIDHHDMQLDSETASEEAAVKMADQLLRASNDVARARSWIDFDDQLYLPILWRLRLFPQAWVFVDEAQDTNPARRALVRMALKPGGRMVAVGDPNQCQPTGTLVYATGRGNVPIESLRKGDELLSYSNGYFPGTVSQGRKVEAVSGRPYKGELIDITADGKTHSVTPNHKCFVRMKNKKGSVVYVMVKGDKARVGWCRQHMVGQFGPGLRKSQEKADALWVIKMFDEHQDDDARLLESTLAYRYGLPQYCFNYNERGSKSGERVRARFWKNFPSNLSNLESCLVDHGLDINYPFSSAGSRAGSKYSFEIHAVNLIDGWMNMCSFNGDRHKPTWSAIKLARRQYKGKVWSLSVQPNEFGKRLYVANGIVTHNCIYGFAGATSNAIDLIQQQFNAVRLPLTVSYRCPKAVGEVARRIVPQFETHEAAPQGAVSTMLVKDALAVLTSHDAILCRNTAPLIGLAYSLMSGGTACHVLGTEIGKGLVNLIKKMRAGTIDGLGKKLIDYREREVAKHMAKGEEGRAEAVSDRVACLETFIEALDENERTIARLIGRIESMFKDGNGALTLSTAHKAKGREWKNVAIYQPELMPSKWARQDWQAQQEQNLIYVAVTRSQDQLIWLTE